MTLYLQESTTKANLMMKVDPTAGRYSLPRLGRESENEPHIVIPFFILFMHVKYISKYVEVTNDTMDSTDQIQ